MPFTTLENFQTAFHDTLSDDEREQLFERERDNILALAKQLIDNDSMGVSQRLGKLLACLHANTEHYAAIIRIFEAKRTRQGGNNPYHLSRDIFQGILCHLKKPAQIKILHDYYLKNIENPDKSPTHKIVIIKVAELQQNINPNAETPEDIKKFTLESVNLFLKTYNLIRSMASFTGLRSNRWEHLEQPAAVSEQTAPNIWNEITSYAAQNPSSRTHGIIRLLNRRETNTLDDDVISSVIQMSFEDAPAYSPAHINGQTFFRHSALKEYLAARNPNTPLTGETVDKVRTALGLVRM